MEPATTARALLRACRVKRPQGGHVRAQRRRGGACCNSAAVHHMLGLVGPQQNTHGCKSHGGERCQYLCNYVHAMCSNQQAHLHALSHTRQLMLCVQDTAKQAQNTAKQVTPPASRAPRRLHTATLVAASKSTPRTCTCPHTHLHSRHQCCPIANHQARRLGHGLAGVVAVSCCCSRQHHSCLQCGSPAGNLNM